MNWTEKHIQTLNKKTAGNIGLAKCGLEVIGSTFVLSTRQMRFRICLFRKFTNTETALAYVRAKLNFGFNFVPHYRQAPNRWQKD